MPLSMFKQRCMQVTRELLRRCCVQLIDAQLIDVQLECHFNSRASATRQHKNPHPATSMAVLRAPHQTTTSTSLAKFSNRSKPCCQPVKTMLQNWSTGQSHVAKLINRSKHFSTVSERVSETMCFCCIMLSFVAWPPLAGPPGFSRTVQKTKSRDG